MVYLPFIQWFPSFQYVMKFKLERLETCFTQAIHHNEHHVCSDYCQSTLNTVVQLEKWLLEVKSICDM